MSQVPHLPITDKTNYPKDQPHAEYPKMPVVTKPRLTANDPGQPNVPDIQSESPSMTGRTAETPVGPQMADISTAQHNQGIQQGGRRDANPVETPETLSRRGEYPKTDMTQSKVMESNDPTHDTKSFKNRSWEGKGFENRRLFY
jgi:hypothetical protein